MKRLGDLQNLLRGRVDRALDVLQRRVHRDVRDRELDVDVEEGPFDE